MTTVEVITSVERRRRWGREDKLRIVAELAQPDRTVSQVARAHGIAAGQLFTWRRQLLAAAIDRHEAESVLCRFGSHLALWQRRRRRVRSCISIFALRAGL